MSIDIRLPNITATDEAGQLAQMRSYLYQFAEQLQWALNTIEGGTGSEQIVLKNSVGEIVSSVDEAKAYDTFNSIKDLIIKSADVVEAYTETISQKLKGTYVAQSDFGNFKEDTEAELSATPKYVEGKFVTTETIDGGTVEREYDLDDLESRIKKQEGTIRAGNDIPTALTPDGKTVGVEIIETDTLGDEVTKRYAVFSAAGIELYGDSETPVVTISQSKITITSAEFDNFVRMGKYQMDLSNGIAFKWIGVITDGND
jgi:hypothetical protein